MKISIKSLAFVGLLAFCLIATPAFSAPTGDGAYKAQCNASDNSKCNAFGPGMNPMWNDGRERMGYPEMGIRGNGPMGMFKGKNGSWKNESWNGTKTMEIRKAGSGFAMSGSQYHVLRMNIEGNIEPDLTGIKMLISDNKTLGQIKSDIKAKMNAEIMAASYNGSLHLGQSNYNLLNIKLTIQDNNSSTINADVAGPKLNAKDKPTTVVGHLTVTASRHENSTIGDGTLTMNSGQYSGQYKVLIEMKGGMGEHRGMRGCAFGGMNHFGMSQKGEKFVLFRQAAMPEDKTPQKA